MTETHIAGELHGLSAHPGDIYHRAAMTVEMLIRERDEARADALSLNGQLQIAGRRFDHADAAVMAAEARIAKLESALRLLRVQALQSNVNSLHNEWGREALAVARAALEDKP
jgi:hypothetical protein